MGGSCGWMRIGEVGIVVLIVHGAVSTTQCRANARRRQQLSAHSHRQFSCNCVPTRRRSAEISSGPAGHPFPTRASGMAYLHTHALESHAQTFGINTDPSRAFLASPRDGGRGVRRGEECGAIGEGGGGGGVVDDDEANRRVGRRARARADGCM
jgi:hypothetical protein